MSLDALKREAAALDERSQRELCAFLISLREKQWQEHLRRHAERLDAEPATRWVSLEQAREFLDRVPEPPTD